MHFALKSLSAVSVDDTTPSCYKDDIIDHLNITACQGIINTRWQQCQKLP